MLVTTRELRLLQSSPRKDKLFVQRSVIPRQGSTIVLGQFPGLTLVFLLRSYYPLTTDLCTNNDGGFGQLRRPNLTRR